MCTSLFSIPIRKMLAALFLTVIFSVFSPVYATDALSVIPHDAGKKRIVVFSTRRTGGHTSAARMIKKQLEPKYDVTIVNVFDEVLHPVDFVYTLSRGKYSGEDFYIKISRILGEWIITPFQWIGRRILKSKFQQITELLKQFLRSHSYDMVISVVPYINYSMYLAARAVDIPSMVVMIDLDSDHWLVDMKKDTYTKFTYGIFSESVSMRAKLCEYNVPSSCIQVLGFPVQKAFSMPVDVAQLKREFKIPTDKPVVMVLMGCEGNKATFLYAQQLAQSTIPLHVCMCIGRDEDARKKINTIKPNPGVTISVIGFTDRISDYMAVADVLITKPGPASIFEAQSRKLPMIIDNTGKALAWEIPQINFTVQNNFGVELRDMRKLPSLLNCFLKDKEITHVIKQAMQKYTMPNAAENIERIVGSMLA